MSVQRSIETTLATLIPGSKLVPDDRTTNWFLMDINHAALVATAYVLIVLLSKVVTFAKRELKFVRVIHNALMTVLNLYMVIRLLIEANRTSWYGPLERGDKGLGILDGVRCIRPKVRIHRMFTMIAVIAMAEVLWLFYVTKVLEFNDTFIMILRQASSQISFLHVYHHVSVFAIWWFNCYYYPGGEAYPSAWLNSFVHVWMYSYYLLATLGIQCWWKKYLTMLQITQLGLFVLQGALLYFTASKEFRVIGVINGIYALTLFVLFIDFYKKSYSRPTRNANAGEAKKSR